MGSLLSLCLEHSCPGSLLDLRLQLDVPSSEALGGSSFSSFCHHRPAPPPPSSFTVEYQALWASLHPHQAFTLLPERGKCFVVMATVALSCFFPAISDSITFIYFFHVCCLRLRLGCGPRRGDVGRVCFTSFRAQDRTRRLCDTQARVMRQ